MMQHGAESRSGQRDDKDPVSEDFFENWIRRMSAVRDVADLEIAAHRRAAVRRSNDWFMALYPCQIRKTYERGTQICQIAVPGGGPAMRGGLRPLFRAGPSRSNAQQGLEAVIALRA